MTTLTVDPQAALSDLQPLADQARGFVASSRSASTHRAYSAQWTAFVAWCNAHALVSMPALPTTVALYLTHRAQTCSVSTMSQGLAALGEAHRLGGYDNPCKAPAVTEVWAGVKRTVGTAQRRVAPAVLGDIRKMVATLPDTVCGHRDRAILVLGFAGAFRRSELAGLKVGDVAFTEDGLLVTVRRSKTDQEGAGETVGLPYGSSKATCPVRSLRKWLDAVDYAEDANAQLFRSIHVHGKLKGAMTGQSIARLVKRTAGAAGLDAANYSGHSLRAGLATTAAKAGKSTRKIAAQGRWKSLSMVERYVRDATLLNDENAASGIGL